MAEEKNNKEMVCRCGAGSCGCGCGWHGGWLKIVRCFFGLVVLVIVFFLGMKIGELRGILESGRYRTMTSAYGNSWYGQVPMMQNGQGVPAVGASSTMPPAGGMQY